MDKDLTNRTFGELEELIESFGAKKYHAKYIFSFIHARDAREISDITPIKKDLRQKLSDAGFYIGRVGMGERFVVCVRVP